MNRTLRSKERSVRYPTLLRGELLSGGIRPMKKKAGCPDKPRNSILRKKKNRGFIRATHEMVF
jgi:hypothetical protein